VKPRGGRTWKETITLERAGEVRTVRVVAEPEPPLAVLVVRLRTGGTEPLAELSMGMRIPEHGTLIFMWNAPVRDGGARFADLAPGRRTVAFRAGDAGFWFCGESEIDLRAGETATIDVALRRGGRARLEALAPDGKRVHARCRILDGEGTAVDVRYRVRDAAGNGMLGLEALQDGDVATEIESALPAGRYTAAVDAEGYRPQRVPFTVRAGETADVTIRLESE
jgi:hypothetical protein